MMDREYKVQATELGTVIWFKENGHRISFNETSGNRHYEQYLAWIAEGNEPEVVE